MRRRKTRQRVLLGLVAAATCLGTAGAGTVRAQDASDAPASTDLADQFGGYELAARANGFQLTYDIKNALPVSPVIQIGVPESIATLSNGPTAYGLASLAYPGPLLADLGAVTALSGTPAPIPPYPIRSQVFFPSEPHEQRQNTVPGVTMFAVAGETASQAVAEYTGGDLPSFLRAGAISAATNTLIEQGQVVSRVRSTMTGVDLFLGLIHIDSVLTELVATTNGKESASAGQTSVTGVKILGLDASLDGEGLHVATPEPAPGTGGPLAPLTDPLFADGSPLAPLAPALEPVAQALTELVKSVVGSTGSVNDLLEAAGIEIKLLTPTEAKSANQVDRSANGLAININFNGSTAPVFSDLLKAIPSEQLPADGIPGFPVNTSPQALVNLLKETQLITMALAPGTVRATVSGAFVPEELGDTGGDFDTGAGSGDGGFGDFGIPTPSLDGGGESAAPGTTPELPVTPIGSLGDAIPLGLALLVLVLAPMFAAGSTRLADNVLAASSSACPEGLDRRTGTR